MPKKKEYATSEEAVKSIGGGLIPGTKRPDRMIATEAGDNAKYLLHSIQIYELPKIDIYDPEQVDERVSLYFKMCIVDDMKPTIAGMSLALGLDRRRFYEITHGVKYPGHNLCEKLTPQSRDIMRKAEALIASQMEDYMQNGKINPVAGIFLMKNMGYTDQVQMNITHNDTREDAESIEDMRKKYVDTVVVDDDE